MRPMLTYVERKTSEEEEGEGVGERERRRERGGERERERERGRERERERENDSLSVHNFFTFTPVNNHMIHHFPCQEVCTCGTRK